MIVVFPACQIGDAFVHCYQNHSMAHGHAEQIGIRDLFGAKQAVEKRAAQGMPVFGDGQIDGRQLEVPVNDKQNSRCNDN
jgi:hypothetical protein